MFTIAQMLHSLFWPLVILGSLLVITVIVVAVIESLFQKGASDFSFYEKRPTVLDTKTELQLFNALLELYSDKYYIFPQVAYSHIVQIKKGTPERERFIYWNKINRKSADFILCDKVQIQPVLVIELDGSSHQLPKRIERDGFIDDLLTGTNLPILHIKNEKMDKEFVKTEIDKLLK